MGNMCGPANDQEVKIYGDVFDANTRSLLVILQFSGVIHLYENIDTIGCDSNPRESF